MHILHFAMFFTCSMCISVRISTMLRCEWGLRLTVYYWLDHQIKIKQKYFKNTKLSHVLLSPLLLPLKLQRQWIGCTYAILHHNMAKTIPAVAFGGQYPFR